MNYNYLLIKNIKTPSLLLFALLLGFSILSCEDERETNTKVSLFINELLAKNDDCCPDELGEYDDWFELYNSGDKDINIEGMYVTDSPGNELYKIPSSSNNAMTVPSKGYLVLWCDKESEQGANHLEMKLKTEGEYIFLIDTDSVTIIDSISFGIQEADISFGRSPDGADNWEFLSVPSPGSPNKQ